MVVFVQTPIVLNEATILREPKAINLSNLVSRIFIASSGIGRGSHLGLLFLVTMINELITLRSHLRR